MNRRQFATWLTLMGASHAISADTLKGETMKVCAIGHTGRGNFGHGLDVVWNRIDSTSIVGVADANPKGLTKAVKKLKLNQEAGFTDYRKMLKTVRPDIVAVCPRHADQHHDMILAAIESGAKGIYVEKPFVRTPREADELIATSDKTKTKIAVAHRNRYQPVLSTIDRLVADGKIGRLLEIRGRGKSDDRGGVEDFRQVGVEIETVRRRLDDRNAKKLLKDADLVIDTFDNSASRASVQQQCRSAKLSCVHVGLFDGYGEVVWDQQYRVPEDVAGDVCDYPLARNLVTLVVSVAAEAIVRFALDAETESYSITLGDFAVRPLAAPVVSAS